MMQATNAKPYWLFDASALTPLELDNLRQAPQIRWVYDHIQDEQATSVGPMLVSSCTYADHLAEHLQADETRAWAVAALHTQADFGALAQHFIAIRYLHTHDGQRYYLRYADSRCLVAIWPVLAVSQQRALLGPVQRWAYTDRQAQHQAVSLGNELLPVAAARPATPLRLSDQQLGNLLQRTWPDQLLCSVSELQPDMRHGLTAWQRYACAQRVCEWLLAKQEERYPVQLEMLKLSLSRASPDWDDTKWLESLQVTYQACAESCT